MDKHRITVAALLAAASMAGAGAAFAQSAAGDASRTATRLELSTEASVSRTPDQVTISAGVMTEATSAQEALATNAQQMDRVMTALRKAGVADKDIRTASINLSPQYRYIDNRAPEITGYQASNQLSLIFRDIARAGPILDALVASGANQIQGPAFGVADSDAALDEARAKAIEKARARANIYARAAGMKVRRIVSISEAGGGPVYPVPMLAMARADKAETVIRPGEQALSISVSVAFELE